MRPDDVFKESFGIEPGIKEDPEQELLDAIEARNDEIEELRQLGFPEERIRSIIEEADSYREELEDLLAA